MKGYVKTFRKSNNTLLTNTTVWRSNLTVTLGLGHTKFQINFDLNYIFWLFYLYLIQ